MGDLLRQYWIPALVASELPESDGPPVRVRLLGEDLVAFRVSTGVVGLVAHSCPHRGASLFFGRNEEEGLRCVYHGWKFDVDGRCTDMPAEPRLASGRALDGTAESNFKHKIRATAYPTMERNGVVWAYMGPRSEPPPLPDLEPNMLPDGEWNVWAGMRECNFVQAFEGDIDTSHLGFLHQGRVPAEAAEPGTFSFYGLNERAPKYAVVDTDYGAMYGAYRPAEAETYYWRIAQYLFPFYTMPPVGVLGQKIVARAWVPMDDEHTMFIMMSPRVRPGMLPPAAGNGRPKWGATIGPVERLEHTSDWYGRFRLAANKRNDYLIDRQAQKEDNYSGIVGIHLQDQAITESMGPIFDRSREHLGTSDGMIIRTRRRLIAAARALREHGATPPGVDDPEVYGVRAGGVILPRTADWQTATEDLRKAFMAHPELSPAIIGNIPGT